MCGIAGFATRPPLVVDRRQVEQALMALEHRGPDDCGFFAHSPHGAVLERDIRRLPPQTRTALLHTRLSILDLSEAGRQPMMTEDGRYCLVFNGEIYNYRELRQELEQRGHRFRSQSDTEVLLKACVEWGTDVLPRLVGMFAFALLDVRENTLLLVRDFFGIKPLFYRTSPDEVAFASEVKVLIEGRTDGRQVNPGRLYQYLCHGLTDHGGETLFADVRQLPPAHYMLIDLDRPAAAEPVRYWNFAIDRPLDISFDEAAGRLRELFLESVQLHLRSDVPVGAALSGGIDSSSIVMAMREIQGSRLDLHLFSYVADDERLSEERWIDLVGRASGATVHKVRLGIADLADDLPRVTRAQDEPFGSTSICAQHRVFQRAREEGIKVMLDGQGADEILAGYPAYYSARLTSLVRKGQLGAALHFWRQAAQRPGASRLSILKSMGNHLLPRGIQRSARQWLTATVAPRWLNWPWFAAHGVRPSVPSHSGRGDVLREQLWRTVEELSLPQLLRYEDRNSMAFSIESRVPFLTPQLVSFVLSLPEEYLISPAGETKAVFRAAMRGLVPDAILDRRDKIGFATPQQQWLTRLRPWAEDLLSSEAAAQVTPLDFPQTVHEWHRILAGRTPADACAWRWLNLIDWTRRYQVEYA